MKLIKVFTILGLISVFLLSCSPKNTPAEQKTAKYIFFFIGDGMGEAHVQLTEAYLQTINSYAIGSQSLSMDTLPARGVASTYCNNQIITGSAASGTALATGNKTNFGVISKSPELNKKYESIAEKYKKQGRKVGIISTVSINHATPAVFYAHQNHRNYYYSIGRELSSSNFDFFGGGGFYKADSIPDENLYTLTEAKGYKVYREQTDLSQLPIDEKIFLINPVLGEKAEMPYAIDRKTEGGYSLAEITKAGIKHLTNDDGFFMMIEGGKIDWAAHRNDAASIVHEVIDFDLAIQEALKFYKEHADETLIVITADHETGGLTLGNAHLGYSTNFSYLKNQSMSYERASRLYALPEDTATLNEAFYVKNMSDFEKSLLKRSLHPQNNPDAHIDYGPYFPPIKTYNQLVNLRSGVGFTTWDHTAIPVPVYAIGVGQEMFTGKYDNTDIPKKILKASGLSFTDE